MLGTQTLTCADCAKPMKVGPGVLPQGRARCRNCRRLNPTHGLSGYKRGCKCDVCRAANAEAARRYSAKVKLRDGVSPTQKYRKHSNAKCTACGVKLRSGAGPHSPAGAATCQPCGRARMGRIKRGRAFRARARRAAIASANGSTGVGAWIQGACLNCGEYFVRKGQASPYCTSVCRRKDRPSGDFITRSRRRAIYARDNWTCQICSGPVDPTLHHLDDWAASLDHVTPQARGGSHEESNLRLAHRWCNSVRGDCTYYTDADLMAG